MGFDLYGLNPTVNKKYPPRYNEIMEEYGKDGMLNWKKDIPEDIKDEYFELKDNYEEENPGSYFRNNVWFWRPLWSFVCVSCDDILKKKDISGGNYNDGHKISKTKAIKMGKRLSEKLADGTIDDMERDYALRKAKADVHNKNVQKHLDEISRKCKDKHGKDLVPANYPEPYKTLWDDMYSNKMWDSDYPFSRDNIEDFAKFCLQSGGFEIC